ncbi:istB-like ATP binding family protein [Bacillus anthracis str. Vollum]|nr:istB-like ATP binding family protein [Bacillus phage vB_BanS_Athena]AIK32804.1 istB-like ATP binding family protein [Bacillus anthracis]AIK64238.1 istB-like ATP binding family protein [Bacillus anthracis str. Vollum]AJG50302.1 istB-like ATP binding family protein [Bacillus anthracis str. Turkey32]AIK50002.1 istB-like ATP binding family protein [Bacillus anthracis]AIK59852.1 istB-like ATP binding family protein [Bacillus anthracis]
MSESIGRVMTRIVNTSACSEETEGYTCEHCNKYIAAITVEVPQLRIKNKILPTCECVVEREEAKIREAQNFAKKREIEKLFSISNLGERFSKSTFESFLDRNGSETAYKVAVKYVKTFKEWNGESLMLWGEPGNGKTHLAAAIVNELSKKGYIVVFQSVPELLQRIRSTFNSENKENETQIMRALLECDLLILDDIGAEKTTEWVEEKLFNIIDGRYRKELPTLYTSNLEPKELKNQVGKRSYDRMVETSLTVKNEAASYRREIAKQRLQRFIEA